MSDYDEKLKTLIEKEEIRDQIYVYCRALDRIDNELGYSVFAEDSVVDYGPTYRGDGRGFIDNMLEQHRHMIATHHMMTNIYIKVDGDKAVSETYMYATCKMPGKEGKTFTVEARCRDIDNWEKRDGKWLIVKRIVAGDNTRILSHYKDLEMYNTSRDDKNDPSYAVLGEIE